MLLADLALVILIWIDAGLARPVTVAREPLPALSVGHTGAVTYRWTNDSRRPVRLRVREVRPTILGGIQASRAVTVAARSTRREDVPVVPVRRGRESSGEGGFVIDSAGPLGLGRRRVRIALPWEVVVYPPLVSMRLRASVAEALRREAGMRPIRQLGEGRLFEALREWGPGGGLRDIDWKARARRHKGITRQYEAETRQQGLVMLGTGRPGTAASDAGGLL